MIGLTKSDYEKLTAKTPKVKSSASMQQTSRYEAVTTKTSLSKQGIKLLGNLSFRLPEFTTYPNVQVVEVNSVPANQTLLNKSVISRGKTI